MTPPRVLESWAGLSSAHEDPGLSWAEICQEEEDAYNAGADEYDRLRSQWEHETGEVW